MASVLMCLATAGLLGCVLAALGLDTNRRGRAHDRRLRRPRRLVLERD